MQEYPCKAYGSVFTQSAFPQQGVGPVSLIEGQQMKCQRKGWQHPCRVGTAGGEGGRKYSSKNDRYCTFVWGSCVLRHQALGLTIERCSSPIRWVRSISTRADQWSPGLREKGQRETAEAWRVADIQTPSMGDSPPECLS